MFEQYLSRSEFDSYEDFYANLQVRVPENFNFAFDVMDALAAERPDERALLWCDEHGAEALFTYADLKALSDKAALALRAQGIGKGDPVMLILKRRWEYWPVLLGLHKLGAIAIPATHLLTVKDIVYRCGLADIAAIVCVSETAARVEEAALKVREAGGALRFVGVVHPGDKEQGAAPDRREAPRKDAPLSNRGPAPCPVIDFSAAMSEAKGVFSRPAGAEATKNQDIMLLYFTSGTTGMPKMVRHDFTYPLGHIVTSRYWHEDEDGGLHLTVADTGWAKAAWGKIYGQWLCRSCVFVYDYDRFVPSAMLETITKYKVTNFCAPPTVYRFFIKEDLARYDFSSLKTCCVAGEPLNPEIYEQWLKATGLGLRECYGQTELTVVMLNTRWFAAKPGSMGKPAPTYDLDLVREDGSSCGMGEEGQLVLRTDKRRPVGMFGGYYRDEALTREVWHDGVYYTGDMAWRDEDGYYWFVGRADDVIKSSGYRIGPFEVESALLEHPAVLECAITGVPDPDRGAVVKASVILAKGFTPSKELEKELQDHVKKTTAPYKYPRIVEFVTELPRTISGKIRRVEIRSNARKA